MEQFRDYAISAIAVLFLVNSGSLFAIEPKKINLDQEVEKAAIEEIGNTHTPSIQVAISVGDNVVYEGAFGMADIENNVKATSVSKYRTASIVKWFTATAAMRLARAGKLDLDEPIQSYCPQYPKKKWEITARQLITHTSGIRHYIDYEKELTAATTSAEKSRVEIKALEAALGSYTRYTDVLSPLKTFQHDELLFKPGTDWEYSSFGYRVLACVLQGAAGKSYVDVIKSEVFEPAKMVDTMPDDAWAIIPGRVSGYRVENGAIRRADLRDVSENLPAGGYLSTASDLVRFAIAFDKMLLPDETKQLMSSPILEALDSDGEYSWRDAIPQEDKYGYGLMLFSKYENGMVGHSGRQAGGSAILVLFPQDDISIAVMSNAKGWNGYINFVMKIKAIIDKELKG
jgi:serine beta-lactamase-like protein LACTB, mitochondrial